MNRERQNQKVPGRKTRKQYIDEVEKSILETSEHDPVIESEIKDKKTRRNNRQWPADQTYPGMNKQKKNTIVRSQEL
jgi:hypothetical protein